MLGNRAIVVLIVITLMGIACGGTALEPVSESQSAQPEPGKLPPSSTLVTSNEGGVNLESCDVLPLLEDAYEVSDYQGWCSYKTDKDYQSAADFYRVQLSAKGWEEFRTTESNNSGSKQTNFYYEKSNRKVAVGVIHTVINSNAGGGSDKRELVIVTIYPDHWIDQPCDRGGVGLPTPEDIPIIGNMIGTCYEDYSWSESGEGSYDYFYITLENFDDTLQFYKSEMIDNGWSLDWEYGDDTLTELHYIKPGRIGTVQSGLNNFVQAPLDRMSVSVMKSEEYGDTQVHIYVTGDN